MVKNLKQNTDGPFRAVFFTPRSTTKQRDCCYFFAESRRPVSDSFPSSFSYSRSSSSQDSTLSSATKEPLRKVSSDAKIESDPVWKRASGGPLSRQTSEGGAGRYGTTLTRQSSTDVGKGKLLTRQLSKGVSEKKSIIPCVQINMKL